MKTNTITLAMLAISVSIGWAKEPAIDIEARMDSIPIIEDNIEAREAQMTEIANDIIRLHRRLDSKLESLVNQLTRIKDSTRSGYRVSKLKMDAIGGLRQSVQTYQRKRAEMIVAIREGRSGIPKEILEREAEHFDEHIEKHIEQMLNISKSFTQDAKVKKYESIEGGGYDYGYGYGWDADVVQISDEWKQNRRDRTMTRKQRKEVIDAFDRSIRRCEQLIARMRDDLKDQSLSKTDRALMRSELNRHLAMFDKRNHQRSQLLLVEQPNTSPVSRDAAIDLEDALDDQIADMRRDLNAIFAKHFQLNVERAKVFKLKANLDARKKWLKEYEAKGER